MDSALPEASLSENVSTHSVSRIDHSASIIHFSLAATFTRQGAFVRYEAKLWTCPSNLLSTLHIGLQALQNYQGFINVLSGGTSGKWRQICGPH